MGITCGENLFIDKKTVWTRLFTFGGACSCA
jgi:hypothetical protein